MGSPPPHLIDILCGNGDFVSHIHLANAGSEALYTNGFD